MIQLIMINMDNLISDTESSDGEDWKSTLHQERIDFGWLNYNPHAFLPLDDHFYCTGSISKIKITEKDPKEG